MEKRAVPLLSCLAGTLLVAAGLWAMGAYVRAAMDDLSMAYWGLVVPMVGIGLVGAGLGFLVLARNAWRGSAKGQVLALRSLLALGLVSTLLAVAVHLRQQRMDAERVLLKQDERLQSDRRRDARKLKPLDVRLDDHDAILVNATPTAGVDDQYRLTVTVSTDHIVYFISSRTLTLQGTAVPITQRLRFEDVFALCFAAAPPPEAYACVRNAEAGEFYTVEARLELLDDRRRSPVTPGHGAPDIVSIRSVGLHLVTRATDHDVMVIGT